MTGFLIVIHVLVCLVLIISVLLQSSKGGGMAGLFGGGGGMGGVFGGRGAASFLSKVTMYVAIGFGATSLLIALFSAGQTGAQQGVVEQVMEGERSSSPAALLPTAPGSDVTPIQPMQPETQPETQEETEQQ